MAFVRYKSVNKRKYYQLVENYREDGKHRQKVLYHLGKHRSLDSAIQEKREEMSKLKDEALHWLDHAQRLRINIIEGLDTAVGIKIPSLDEIPNLDSQIVQQRREYFDLPFHQHSSERLNELDKKLDVINDLYDYHFDMQDVARYLNLASEKHAEVIELVELKQRYL